MPSLELAMVVILYTERAWHFLFINIYTFIDISLLTFSCIKSNNIS